eukprot:3252105-Pyramimonas_sp.AAC.1
MEGAEIYDRGKHADNQTKDQCTDKVKNTNASSDGGRLVTNPSPEGKREAATTCEGVVDRGKEKPTTLKEMLELARKPPRRAAGGAASAPAGGLRESSQQMRRTEPRARAAP